MELRDFLCSTHQSWCGMHRTCKHHGESMNKPQLMKGHSWSDRFKGKALRFSYPVVCEIKTDEIRTHFRLVRDSVTEVPVSVEAVSYAGKPLHNLGSICEKLFSFMCRHDLEELDCGVLCNGNFNDSYRLVRSSKGTPEDLVGKPVVVILFDIPQRAYDYSTLLFTRGELATNARYSGINMWVPRYWVAGSEEEVMAAFAAARQQGEEGLMVKTLDHMYERKRSYGWYKLKPTETYDGRITGINRAVALDGTPHDRAGSISVELEDGSVADPSGLAHDLAADMFANPGNYVGRWVEFKAMERDRKGGYRHPIFIRIREDKE